LRGKANYDVYPNSFPLPTEILKRYKKWKGYRSSRLNLQYRVIYKIENEQFFVQVVKVTAHDFQRK
jgi:mRNA-degrading endonuclease YafQ of YafQ-DinJ toxin-antitoxin module